MDEKNQLGIVIKNLAFSVTEQELTDFIKKNYGPSKTVKLIVDEKKRSKGFAFVDFEDKDAMKKAVDAREFRLAGRLALITQSLRDITDKKRDDKSKKRLHKETDEKEKQDKT